MAAPPFSTVVEPGRIVVTARGATGSELFAASSAAYFSSVCRLTAVRAVEAYELERQADSLEELYLGWMNDLVWVFSEQEVVCAQVSFSHWSRGSYAATLLGEPLDATRHEPHDVVEAVSGEGLELHASEGSWTARVILLT
jgi:SHS2 domain-containing protein